MGNFTTKNAGGDTIYVESEGTGTGGSGDPIKTKVYVGGNMPDTAAGDLASINTHIQELTDNRSITSLLGMTALGTAVQSNSIPITFAHAVNSIEGRAGDQTIYAGDIQKSTSVHGTYQAVVSDDLDHGGFTNPTYLRIPAKGYPGQALSFYNGFNQAVELQVYALYDDTYDTNEYSTVELTPARTVASAQEMLFLPDVTMPAYQSTGDAAVLVHLPQTPCAYIVVRLQCETAPTEGRGFFHCVRSGASFPSNNGQWVKGQTTKANSWPVTIASDQGALGTVALTGNTPDTVNGDLARINPNVMPTHSTSTSGGINTNWDYSSISAITGYSAFNRQVLGAGGMSTNNFIRIPAADQNLISLNITSSFDEDVKIEILAWLTGESTSHDALAIYSKTFLANADELIALTPYPVGSGADSAYAVVEALRSPASYFVISYKATGASPTAGELRIRMASK